MSSDADILKSWRLELQKSLICFPTELIPIVGGYAVELPHSWSNGPAADNFAATIVDGTEAKPKQRHVHAWNHIVSNRSIFE
jgi:hypothetical protein